MLKFKLNVAERKTLAKRMEELTGIHTYYTKAPLYSYDIGSYTIDRNGNLLVEPENADAELLTTLLNEGLIRGGESIESTDDQPEDTELTADMDEEPVTEAETEQMPEAELEVLDEQESEDADTAEDEPAEAGAEDALEPDNTAEDDTIEDEPDAEKQAQQIETIYAGFVALQKSTYAYLANMAENKADDSFYGKDIMLGCEDRELRRILLVLGLVIRANTD